MGNEVVKMGEIPYRCEREENSGEEITFNVDDRGRVTLPKEVQKQLGIKPNDRVPATLVGSVLEVNPQPSSNLVTASANCDDWEDTTPTDAGKSLFGPVDGE
jgi:AbrB family looped-hinge helix DNA binding protein